MFKFNRTFGHFFKNTAIITLLTVISTAVLVMHVQADNATKQAAESVILSESPVININNASADELADALDGVGLERAKAIVIWREQHGQFEQVDDLLKVKGIGKKILSINKEKIGL